jgi:hypothetical protein
LIQIGLNQVQNNFEHKKPTLDGTAAKFSAQTLSKVASDSDATNFHVETQQVQMTMPGIDSNSDCTTKFRKVVYSGKGIDMNVMNEAKRYTRQQSILSI